MFLYKLLRHFLYDPHSLGQLIFRIPATRSSSDAVFIIPMYRTVVHVASPLLRMMRSSNALPPGLN